MPVLVPCDLWGWDALGRTAQNHRTAHVDRAVGQVLQQHRRLQDCKHTPTPTLSVDQELLLVPTRRQHKHINSSLPKAAHERTVHSFNLISTTFDEATSCFFCF